MTHQAERTKRYPTPGEMVAIRAILGIIIGAVRTPLFISWAFFIVGIPLLAFGDNASFEFLRFFPGLGNREVITETDLIRSLGTVSLILSYGVLLVEYVTKKTLSRAHSFKLSAGVYTLGYVVAAIACFVQQRHIFDVAIVIFGVMWLNTMVSLCFVTFLRFLYNGPKADTLAEGQ